MAKASKTTYHPAEKTLQWASDWADAFDQDWDEEKLAAWVGKRVEAHTPDSSKGFVATIVGFSRDCIPTEEGRKVFRNSFLTDEGLQVALYTSMVVEEAKEEE